MGIEQQIIEMAENGMSQRKIAKELSVSPATVNRILNSAKTTEDEDSSNNSFTDDPDDDMMPLSEMDEQDVPIPEPAPAPVPPLVPERETAPLPAARMVPLPPSHSDELEKRLFGLAERAVETQNRLNGQLTAMAIRAEEAKNEAVSSAAALRGSVAAKEREITRSRAYSIAAFSLAFTALPAIFELGWLARSIGVRFDDYLRCWVFSGIALVGGLLAGIALMLLAKKHPQLKTKNEEEV